MTAQKRAFNHFVRVFVYIIDSKDEYPAFGKPLGFTNTDLRDLENIIVQGEKTKKSGKWYTDTDFRSHYTSTCCEYQWGGVCSYGL